jgi:hypothetical protein
MRDCPVFREDKMRIAISVVVTLVMLFCVAPVNAIIENGTFIDMNSPGFGARSRAMGGVYMALANDGYGSFENPATMSLTNKSLMTVEIVNSQDKHSGLSNPLLYRKDLNNAIVNYVDHKQFHTALTQAGAVAPFTYFGRDWWVGGGYRTIYDMYLKSENQVYPNIKNSESRARSANALNLALATKLISNISVGINLNYYVRGYEDFNYYAASVQDTSHTWIDYTGLIKTKSSISGASVDFGAMADYGMISAGFVVRAPYTLKEDMLILEGSLTAYGDEYGTIWRKTEKNKFPLTFGGGVAIRPLDKLTIAGDVDFRPYSKARVDINWESQYIPDTTDWDFNLNDLTQLRFGAEYVLNAGFAQIPMRAGYHNQPGVNTLDDVTFDSIAFDTSWYYAETGRVKGKKINTNIFSFGSGIKFERVWFDFAYEFGSSKYNHTVTNGHNDETWSKTSQFKYSKIYLSMGMLF